MLILASASPRRKEIMELVGLDFKVVPSTIDEKSLVYHGRRLFLPEFLATKKAEDVFSRNKDDIVIASDTIVICGDDVFGKPIDKEEAKMMLRELSNKTHTVATGVCIKFKDQTITFTEVTGVTFYPLSEQDIDEYIATNEPIDKAGAYAIQGKGAKYIKKIEGDFYTVMGLPISKILHELNKLGIKY